MDNVFQIKTKKFDNVRRANIHITNKNVQKAEDKLFFGGKYYFPKNLTVNFNKSLLWS